METLKKYGALAEPEVKQLVIDRKWHIAITTRVASELLALTLALVDRIEELGERYDETLNDLETTLAALDKRVEIHLADMGIK